MEYILYHATDKSCAKKIVNGNFVVKANYEHWLGNGIYFYFDKALAKWWATNPSKRFGIIICEPAILKIKINIPDEKVLDLRDFNNFTEMINELQKYFKNLIKENSVIELNWDQVVCSFFNYYFAKKGIALIIGSFDAVNQPYNIGNKDSIIGKTKLRFVETQICLLDNAQEYIVSKEII